MKYREFTGFVEDVRVGDTVLSPYAGEDNFLVEKIVKRNGGYDFYSDVINIRQGVYTLTHLIDDGTVHIRRKTLSQVLKEL